MLFSEKRQKYCEKIRAEVSVEIAPNVPLKEEASDFLDNIYTHFNSHVGEEYLIYE